MIPPRAWSLSAQQWLALLSALSWERAQRPASIDDLQAALAPQTISESTPVHPAPGTTGSTELAAELMPRQSSWGFFVFVACAVAVILIATQRREDVDAGKAPTREAGASTLVARLPPRQTTTETYAATAPVRRAPAAASQITDEPAATTASASVPVATASTTARADRPRAAAPRSEITFENPSILTTEGAVAAVFLIKRSQPLSQRARVSWRAVSGSADAGIDFASKAGGSVEFASGQAQRAIYVPLRNDLLKEGDETFTVELRSPQGARLGSIATAVATIRDDD